MSVTEMNINMFQKKLSEHLFCVELHKFSYPDEILEIVSHLNNLKSDGLLAKFLGISLGQNQQPLFFLLPQSQCSPNYFLITLVYPPSKHA